MTVVSCGTLSLQWKSVSVDFPPVLSKEGLFQHRELVLALLILYCGVFLWDKGTNKQCHYNCNSKSHCQTAPGYWVFPKFLILTVGEFSLRLRSERLERK